ncbi:mucin-7-like [Mus caroli]|uniref:Mucin-7-like n=1 Tax=Mus caroli TaxID=10089 RepID=A0A6P7PQS2_MUSCR|nr:mucin-7-like [Mus caroli]
MRLRLQGAAPSARPPLLPSPSEYSSLPPARAGRPLRCSAAPRRPLAAAPAPSELAAGGEWAVASPVHALASPLPRPEGAPPPCPPSPPTFLGLGTRDAAPLFQSHELVWMDAGPGSQRACTEAGPVIRAPAVAYGKPSCAIYCVILVV